jgi:1,4-alpha-glucan branching enzyme
MGSISVEFVYHTGIARELFRNVRLSGSWDAAGQPADTWTTVAMTETLGVDGCPSFHATVDLPEVRIGQTYSWGVLLDSPAGRDVWAIPTETGDADSTARHRTFILGRDSYRQEYWLNTSRRLGANKRYDNGSPRMEFAVWAPNARQVSVVFGDPGVGYIGDDGSGIDQSFGAIEMGRNGDGVWTTDPADSRLSDFEKLHHRPYMFQIVKDNGRVAYRSDLYARCQIGKGTVDPANPEPGQVFSGRHEDLDGTVSCSLVVDPDQVAARFDDPRWPPTEWLSDEDFWRNEFDPMRPLPTRIEDLVIYELHVGGLGAGNVDARGNPVPGNLADAMVLLDHFVDLGINAIELLPIAEFEGWASWGYGSSHYFAIEFSGGGRDQVKHFVRACHQRGLAVILDVVYNHYHHHAERAEWAYDSDEHSRNIYYWYEGRDSDYADPTGGYVDNLSTGWAPRFWEEKVRQMLVSSALVQLTEFHIDGFRADQTTSMHQYAVSHADGRSLPNANAFGAKCLRELSRAVRLVKPSAFLIAEDHSGWDGVTRSPDSGGLGFDAVWYADFYHHLAGDTGHEGSANLLTTAGYGDNRPLAMEYFAGALLQSANDKVVYHESHDEAGNSRYRGGDSGRTLAIAVRDAPLVGDTRRWAEARARFAAGMSILSAGTPMFFMGEEIGAVQDYRYNDFVWYRENIAIQAKGAGRNLFAFYRGLIDLRLAHPAVRSRHLDVVHVHNANRVIAFRRTYGADDLLVLASLNDTPFTGGYRIDGVPDGTWREIFNSDVARYGGWGDGNAGVDLSAAGGSLAAVLPRAGLSVLQRV